ncbi:hypothetical protein PLESTM_000797600 [Pleodorina starrii]|nr:hypothetical protein PLESTM_000797600 [Pleodorina starrii]
MGLSSLLLGTLRVPSIRKANYTVLRLAAVAGFATLLVYVVGNTISFIVQLFELSSSEVSKFAKVIAALLKRPNLDLEFLPQEFEDLTPSDEGVYAYAPGTYHPLLFRRAESAAERGAWQWSDDGRLWFATDSFRESPNGVPEPPALVFILRLHIETLIRRRFANPAADRRRLPPPLDTDECPAAALDAAPAPLCCPISHGLMRVPVVAPSGTTFEYDCIRRWAQRHNTDPVNGGPLAEGDLYPNLALRDLIDRWLQQQGGRRRQGGWEQQDRQQGGQQQGEQQQGAQQGGQVSEEEEGSGSAGMTRELAGSQRGSRAGTGEGTEGEQEEGLEGQGGGEGKADAGASAGSGWGREGLLEAGRRGGSLPGGAGLAGLLPPHLLDLS